MTEPFSVEQLPNCTGAYVLQINVQKEHSFFIKTLGEISFSAGRYVYCGSAKGPGGIRARVRRHVKRDKKAHWHVDRLTIQNGVESLSVFIDQTECDLVSKIMTYTGVEVLKNGFGSSDCPGCLSHLLKLPHGLKLDQLGLSQPVFHLEPDRLS